MAIGCGERRRVDAVERVGPVQVPPAAGGMGATVLVPVLTPGARGGVAAGLLHAAATVLVDGVRGRGRVLRSRMALAVAKEAAGLLRVQAVYLQGRAGGRGALGLRVQRGGGRRQRAFPPDTSPLSAAVSLRQLPEHSRRWRRRRRRRRRCSSTVLAVRVGGARTLRRKAALLVKLAVRAGDCSKYWRGFPKVHPSDPRIHWTRVCGEPLHVNSSANSIVCIQINNKSYRVDLLDALATPHVHKVV